MCFSIFFCYQYVVMTNQSFVVNLWLDIIKLGYSYLGRIDNSAYKALIQSSRVNLAGNPLSPYKKNIMWKPLPYSARVHGYMH